MAITRYRTIAERFRYEPDKIKGSRFIADLAPVVTVAEAEGLLAEVRTEFPDAGHHCYAWIIDPEGKQTRSSDDGEPGSLAYSDEESDMVAARLRALGYLE